MAKRQSARPTSAPGVKYLITAASVAATIVGWAALSAPLAVPTPVEAEPVAPVEVVLPPAAPIPTLVPLARFQEDGTQDLSSAQQPVVAPPLRSVTLAAGNGAIPTRRVVARTHSSR
jgi:hypothetical protein